MRLPDCNRDSGYIDYACPIVRERPETMVVRVGGDEIPCAQPDVIRGNVPAARIFHRKWEAVPLPNALDRA